jgi:hydrogenase maturation protease
MVILGIGNVLQKDDGLGVYAATYLQENYTFSEPLKIIDGGTKGIHLLNLLEENDHIVILDALGLEDSPGSIYAIPGREISGYGLNNGGAHEIGILQCMDMMELQGKEVPLTMVIGMVPEEVTFAFGLSKTVENAFENYISVILQYLVKHGINAHKNNDTITLGKIIQKAEDPSVT